MSEEQPARAPPAEHGPLPRRSWDGAAAVIAALVGLLALCVSGYTAWLQRQQVRAQEWPYIETGISSSKHDLTLVNKGVGPALIRSVQIYVDGKPQRDWDAVYAALGLKFDRRPPYSTVNSIVISAGERIEQVAFRTGRGLQSLRQAGDAGADAPVLLLDDERMLDARRTREGIIARVP